MGDTQPTPPTRAAETEDASHTEATDVSHPRQAPTAARFYGPVGLTDDLRFQTDPAQARAELERARRERPASEGPTYPERVLGCVLVGAVGDALGGGVEFDEIDAIRARYGPDGLTDYTEAYGRVGAITDDTQMSMFTLDGLIRAHIALRRTGDTDLARHLHRAYLRWLHTQHDPVPEHLLGGWLLDQPDLHHRRAPGNTCLTALRASLDGRRIGTPEEPINNSKGCGAVMRAAPIALWPTTSPAETFRHAAQIGALTHGHPSGYLSAAAFAVIIRQLFTGRDLRTALAQADSELTRTPDSDETIRALHAGWALGLRGRPTPQDLATLGGGWTGEEALAIAVCAALAAHDLEDGLLLATNHSGDSDSTAALAGNLLGAQHGPSAIPTRWLDQLELRPALEQLTGDALDEFGPTPPDLDSGWLDRYPLHDPARGEHATSEPRSGDD